MHQPYLPSLHNDFAPLFLTPSAKGEHESDQVFIAEGSDFSTVDDGPVTANLSVPDTQERSKELVPKVQNQEASPHQDPSSIRQNPMKQPNPFSIGTLPSLPVDAVSTNNFASLRFGDPSIFTSIDLVRFSFSANFVSKHDLSSSATKLECAVVIFVFETDNTTTKTKGNTIFVFDPGGTFTDVHHSSVHRYCHQKFQKLHSHPVCLHFHSILPSSLNHERETIYPPRPQPWEQCLSTPPLQATLCGSKFWTID